MKLFGYKIVLDVCVLNISNSLCRIVNAFLLESLPTQNTQIQNPKRRKRRQEKTIEHQRTKTRNQIE